MANPSLAPLVTALLKEANNNNPLMEAAGDSQEMAEMMEAMMKYLPIRALANFSQGNFTEEMLTEVINKFNQASKEQVV